MCVQVNVTLVCVCVCVRMRLWNYSAHILLRRQGKLPSPTFPLAVRVRGESKPGGGAMGRLGGGWQVTGWSAGVALNLKLV